MPTLIAWPEQPAAAAVVIVNDVGGLSPFYEHLAARLARAGFLAVDPEFFHRLGAVQVPIESPEYLDRAIERMLKLDDELLLADLGAAIDHARRLTAHEDGRVAVIGFCMGGTCALALASRRCDLAASVAYYGVPVPRRGVPGFVPLNEVGRICTPVLAHWGDADEAVGLRNIEAYRTAVAARGQVTVHIYPGLGHGFLRAFDDPASAAYELARLSWARTLEFLHDHLD